MNAWQELVRQALIGNVSSKKISPILIEKFKHYGLDILSNAMPEKNILKAAAIHNKLYTAAQIPVAANSNHPAPAQEETQAYCNAPRKQQLQYVLKQKYDGILSELLQLLIDKKVIAVPELLPELLQYGANRPSLQPLIRQFVGNRGSWLAQFSPEWRYATLSSIKDDETFFYGNYDDRLLYLKEIHAQQPVRAIELLEQVWESEGFTARADFITALGHQPADSDEAFLENALQDKRKEVRDQAARLLARLPHSRLVQRMQQLIENLVVYDAKKNKFEVALPETCTTHMKRDGILARKSFIKDHGPKANQLAQIIAKVPPQWWEKTFYKNPQQLLHLASKTEWKNVFVWGWAMAAKNFENYDWVLACHQFYLDTFFKHDWSNFSIDFLYKNLPNPIFNQLAKAYLEADNKKVLSDEHPIVTFLLAEGQPWDDNSSLPVIKRIQNTIHQGAYVFHWNLKTVLKRAAFAINPQLYAKIQEGWPEQVHAWHSWQKEVDNMLTMLKFRLEIQETSDE